LLSGQVSNSPLQVAFPPPFHSHTPSLLLPGSPSPNPCLHPGLRLCCGGEAATETPGYYTAFRRILLTPESEATGLAHLGDKAAVLSEEVLLTRRLPEKGSCQ
jgi:hypothetical protein